MLVPSSILVGSDWVGPVCRSEGKIVSRRSRFMELYHRLKSTEFVESLAYLTSLVHSRGVRGSFRIVHNLALDVILCIEP